MEKLTTEEKLKIIEKEIRDFLPELREQKRVLIEFPIKLNDVLRFVQGEIKRESNLYVDSLGDFVIVDIDGDFRETNARWDLDKNHLCNQNKSVIDFVYRRTKHSKLTAD